MAATLLAFLLWIQQSCAFPNIHDGRIRTSSDLFQIDRFPRALRLGAASEDNDLLGLPVFPLRKSVKLPSECVTLNLYEDRYLKLAEYVLNQDKEKRCFGALYCSHKPQIVKQAQGDIVPMVADGDMGVVCRVMSYEEGTVPISQSDPNGPWRRRIKLNAVAVSRFRISRILQDGYGFGSHVTKGVGAPPFIVVEAVPVDDKTPPVGSVEDKELVALERELFEWMISKRSRATAGEEARVGDCSTSGRIDLTSGDFKSLLPSNLVGISPIDRPNEEHTSQSEIAQSLMLSGSNERGNGSERQRREVFSFIAACSLLPMSRSPTEMLKLLHSTSYLERMQYVVTHMKSPVLGWSTW